MTELEMSVDRVLISDAGRREANAGASELWVIPCGLDRQARPHIMRRETESLEGLGDSLAEGHAA